MRVAALISGLPRFTKDFDHTLQQLLNYDQIDWYFYLWNKDSTYDAKITPSWPINDPNEVYRKIKSHLPANNKIANLQIVEMPSFDPNKHYNFIPTATPQGVWTMHYGLKQVNLLRTQTNIEYDLVIRTRPDVSINRVIFLDLAKTYLESRSKSIIMPDNARYGFNNHRANDQFAIGLPKIVDTYCNAFDYLEQYAQEGLPMSGELLLAFHLEKNQIEIPPSDFESIIRQFENDTWGSWK